VLFRSAQLRTNAATPNEVDLAKALAQTAARIEAVSAKLKSAV